MTSKENIPIESGREQPGALNIRLKITLNTKEATTLFYGRKATKTQHAIIGLNTFAQRVKYITNAARFDDPYADYFLLQVETTIEQSIRDLKRYKKALDKRLNRNSLLQIKSSASNKPIVITTNYSSPYANMATHLLKQADDIFLMIHILAHIGLLTRSDKHKRIEHIKTLMRRTFLSQRNYRFFNIKRNDLALDPVKARKAQISMHFKDVLPKDILNRKRRAKFAPNILAYSEFTIDKPPSIDKVQANQ